MPRHPCALLFPLFALFMVSVSLSADEVAEAALRYADQWGQTRLVSLSFRPSLTPLNFLVIKNCRAYWLD
jgi:hypothetical protein